MAGKTLELINKEVVLVLGFLVTVGEIVLQAVPSGSVTTSLRLVLPPLGFLLARMRVVPLASLPDPTVPDPVTPPPPASLPPVVK